MDLRYYCQDHDLHSAIHWPDMADPKLWPMVVARAAYVLNHTPKETNGLSAMDVFSRCLWEKRRFHDLHVWGSPVYVLDKKASDGKKIPLWQLRSQRCMFMGFSSEHASTVPLVFNPSTGTITPKWDVVFDDWFSTVTHSKP